MNVLQTNANTAHSLYALYETLPDTVQREFLSELWQKNVRNLKSLPFIWIASKRRKRVFK